MRAPEAQTRRRIALFGIATPFAADVEAVALRAGYVIVAAINNVGGQPGVNSSPIYGLDEIPDLGDMPCFFPMVQPVHRKRAYFDAKDLGLTPGGVLADPRVALEATEFRGEGTFVNAGAVIGAGTQVGSCVVINRSASIGHHGVLGDFCSIGPGAALGGGVTVGESAFIGVGAVVLPELTIGPGCLVGAGAVVVRDVEPGATVVGNPARALHRD